jgi:hemoglobin-like flavoprotein
MTAQEIMLVKNSFQKLGPTAEQVSALFYARLFELDPSLRNLFHGDMATQGCRFMQMIASAVTALDRIDAIKLTFRQLGARHIRYGVRDEHYATVGTALLWTLDKSLGSDFTPAVKSAWTVTYALFARTMMDGAHSAANAA